MRPQRDQPSGGDITGDAFQWRMLDQTMTEARIGFADLAPEGGQDPGRQGCDGGPKDPQGRSEQVNVMPRRWDFVAR